MPPSHQTTLPELEYCRSVSCLQKNVHVEHRRGEQTIRPMMKQTWPTFREFMACGNTSTCNNKKSSNRFDIDE